MAISDDYAFATAVTIMSLVSTNQDLHFHFKILNTNLTEKNKKLLLKINKNIEFIKVSHETLLNSSKELGINKFDDDFTLKTLEKRPVFYLAKIEMLRFLASYNDVIFTDVDILFQGSIKDILYKKGMSGRNAAKNLLDKIGKIPQLEKVTDRLDIDTPTPNAGFVYFSGIKDWKPLLQEAYRLLINYEKEFALGVDEALFAWICFKHSIPVNILSSEYNHSVLYAHKNSIVVHALGSHKFWNDKAIQITFPLWNKFYDKWLEIGGEGYEGFIYNKRLNSNNYGRNASNLIHAEIWAYLYNNIGFDLPVDLMPSYLTVETHSKIFIKNIDRTVHYELQCPDLSKFSIHLFWKEKLVLLDTDFIRNIQKSLHGSQYKIQKRNDMLEIKRPPVPRDEVVKELSFLSSKVQPVIMKKMSEIDA